MYLNGQGNIAKLFDQPQRAIYTLNSLSLTDAFKNLTHYNLFLELPRYVANTY